MLPRASRIMAAGMVRSRVRFTFLDGCQQLVAQVRLLGKLDGMRCSAWLRICRAWWCCPASMSLMRKIAHQKVACFFALSASFSAALRFSSASLRAATRLPDNTASDTQRQHHHPQQRCQCRPPPRPFSARSTAPTGRARIGSPAWKRRKSLASSSALA